MNKISVIGVFCGLLFFPFVAFGADLTASGWGDAATNGTFVQIADINGKDAWNHGSRWICWDSGGSYWGVREQAQCLASYGDVIYANYSAVDSPLEGTWLEGTGSTVGTFTPVGGGGGDGSFDVSVAVISSSSAAVTNWFTSPTGIAYLLVLWGALVGLGVGIYLFRKLIGWKV